VRGLGFILKGFFSARCRKLSNCTVEIKEVEFESNFWNNGMLPESHGANSEAFQAQGIA